VNGRGGSCRSLLAALRPGAAAGGPAVVFAQALFFWCFLFCHPMLTVLAVTVLRWGLWSISYFDFIFGYCMEGMIQVAVATLWKVKAACEILISLSPGKLIFRCWENKVVVVYLVQLQILENMFLGVSYEKAAVSL
jgi:hypothetical protein